MPVPTAVNKTEGSYSQVKVLDAPVSAGPFYRVHLILFYLLTV
jgi:hypothetical protein